MQAQSLPVRAGGFLSYCPHMQLVKPSVVAMAVRMEPASTIYEGEPVFIEVE